MFPVLPELMILFFCNMKVMFYYSIVSPNQPNSITEDHNASVTCYRALLVLLAQCAGDIREIDTYVENIIKGPEV